MKRITTSLLLLLSLAAGAQEAQRRWHFEVDLRYQHMMARQYTMRTDRSWRELPSGTPYSDHQKLKLHDNIFDYGFPQKYGGNTLMLMETYRINPRLTVGLGLLLMRYAQEDFDGLTIAAQLRYQPWRQHPYGYWYTELGPGMVSLGWGTSVRLSQRRHVDFKVGYNLLSTMQDFDLGGGFSSDKYTDAHFSSSTHTYMHCLQAGVGIVF